MDEEICDGVKILCERMASNPEDFQETEYDPSTLHRKLGRFYYEGKEIESLAKGEVAGKDQFWYLNDTEKAMLVKAYLAMRRTWATQKVVEKLLAVYEPEDQRVVRPGPLTKQQITREAMAQLNVAFDKAYETDHLTDTIKYKAIGRYKLGMP